VTIINTVNATDISDYHNQISETYIMKCTKIKCITRICKNIGYLDYMDVFIRMAIETGVFLIQKKINLYHTEIGDSNPRTSLPARL
jgi:hypothetical protein